jgi:hypothetical protein
MAARRNDGRGGAGRRGRRAPGGSRIRIEREGPANTTRWTDAMVRRLGKEADATAARRFGLSRTVVAHERRRRGIAPFDPRRKPFVWTRRALALLGTMSDRDVGAELGVTHGTVGTKRRVLGIAPFHAPPHLKFVRAWRRREEALLGTMSDRELAERLGCSTPAVSQRRRELGIPAFRPQAAPIRWTRRRLARLGKVSDESLAREMGVTMIAVNFKRRRLGIPPFREVGKVVLSPELRRLLRQPTSVVRRRTGLEARTIARLRTEHGIQPPRPRPRPRERGPKLAKR